MLSRLKRKTDSAPAAAPAWHPNFRNFERLPDTKVVRTAFFVNAVALVLAALVLLWFAYRTFQLRAVREQIAEVQAQIDRNRPTSEKTLAMYRKFQGETTRVNEVEAFVKSRPRMSALLLRLAETLPANIALDGFEYRSTLITLRASLRGAPDQASGYASTYLQQLKQDAVLKPLFDDITLQSLTRNPQTGRLTLEMNFKLKPEAKK